jgi:hypothetical protein
MRFLFHLKALVGSKVAAVAGAAVLVGGGAAVASPAPQVLEVVPASDGANEDAPDEDAPDEERSDGERSDDEPDEAFEDEVEGATENGREEDPESGLADELPEEAPAREEPAPLKDLDVVAPEDDVEDQSGRSEVAEAVHRALSGGLSPEDDGFGEAVAENARKGGNGGAASEAARGANGSAGRGPGGHGPPGHAKGPGGR